MPTIHPSRRAAQNSLKPLPLLLAAVFACQCAYAADTDAQAQAENHTRTASAPAPQQVQEQTQTLPEVTVIGERARRSSFQTATSHRVFTTPDIDRSGHNLSATDLLKQTVNTVDLGSGNDLPTVRGVDGSGPAVGAVAFFAGTRPRLNLSIDGRSATYNEYAFGTQSLWDMRQVEVLRGPQSDVRGQHAVAGAVVMRSNDPTPNWEGALRLGLGNQKTCNAAAVLSGPIVKDNLSFRLSAERQQRESYEPFVRYEPVGNPRRVENTNVRLKLLYAPAAHPEFHSRLTYNHIRSRTPQNEILGNTASRRFLKEKPVFVTGSNAVIWDTSWQAADNLRLENKLIYTRYTNERLHLPITVNPQGVPAGLKGREVQWEPSLHWKTSSGSLKGLAGLYFFRSTQDEWVDIRSVGGHNSFKDKNRVAALFAETDIRLAPQWRLTLAGRIERESHQRHGGSRALNLDLDKGQTVFLPKAEIAYQPSEQFNTSLKAARGYNPGGAGITFGRPVQTYTYKPEYVTNLEWFTRWRSPDKRLALGSNVFFNQYKDMQLPFYLGPNSVVIRNADKVHTRGAELTADWQPLDGLKLHAALGLLHSKIKRYPNSGIEGRNLGRAPKYTANLGAGYQHRSGWEIGGDVRFTGRYYSAADNAESGKIGAYSQTNLYAAYNFKQGRVSLYADNVFNSRRAVFISTSDRLDALYQRPRSVGVSAEVKF